MKTTTYQIDPGEKVVVKNAVRRKIHILLNKEDTGIFVSDKLTNSGAPPLRNSAYIRAEDCPVRFVHEGNFTLWASTRDTSSGAVGVSIILEDLEEEGVPDRPTIPARTRPSLRKRS